MRLVFEHKTEHGSQWAALNSISDKIAFWSNQDFLPRPRHKTPRTQPHDGTAQAHESNATDGLDLVEVGILVVNVMPGLYRWLGRIGCRGEAVEPETGLGSTRRRES